MNTKVAITEALSYEPDIVRAAFKKVFDQLGLDQSNPFGSFIKPGDKVFIKPNWVAHRYRKSCAKQYSLYSTITHPEIIRATVDFVAKALNGKGLIIIGDNPSIDADFNQLIDTIQLNDICKKYKVDCEIIDLRPFRCDDLRDYGIKEKMVKQSGDPLGEVSVNLGRKSLLHGKNPRLFRGVFNDRTETIAAHSKENQIYKFSKSIISADVYISLPKMKTHHKVGTTLNLKGLVGTVSQKDLLVHWRNGWPMIGGDEYPSFGSWLKGSFAKVKSRGAWPGNDTIWRMVVDLYTAFQKIGSPKTFSIVDGIMAGEANGPFCPAEKAAHSIVAGENLLAVDMATTRLMGFDITKIPYLLHYLKVGAISTNDIEVLYDKIEEQDFFQSKSLYLNFKPPTNWSDIIVR